jgi:chemotaxis protein methyltransferase CheR
LEFVVLDMIDLSHQEQERLRDLITRYSGLGGSLQPDEALERAVALRMTVHGLDNLADYWPLIQGHQSGELNSLVQLLTNKETFFFREMHHFEVLLDRILPDLVAARKFHSRPDLLQEPSGAGEREPLRLWSAGCSTGEEAYSLAIILLEYQKRFGRLESEIVGTDIDASALETARWGQYGERSIRLVPANLLRQYFTFDGQTFRISPEAARMVRFQLHNLADEHFPPELANMDVIFCRNVSTFFDREARERLNTRLAGSLRDGGYLFVASTETMNHNRGELELFPVGKTFLFRKRSSAVHLVPSLAPASVAAGQPDLLPLSGSDLQPAHISRPIDQAQSPADPAGIDPPETWLYRARRAFQHKDYDAVLSALDQISTAEPVVLDLYSLRAAALVQQGRLDEAETACQYLLAHDPWDIDAHFLMGLIFYRQGQAEAAIQSLKTAVYFQPEHRWAHFHLGEAYQALGLKDNARREYRSTLNILRAAHLSPWEPELNLSGLDDDFLRQACQVNLEKLE